MFHPYPVSVYGANYSRRGKWNIVFHFPNVAGHASCPYERFGRSYGQLPGLAGQCVVDVEGRACRLAFAGPCDISEGVAEDFLHLCDIEPIVFDVDCDAATGGFHSGNPIAIE